MKIGIPKEIFEDERRVAATPPSVHKLIGLGYDVIVEGGAGEAANYLMPPMKSGRSHRSRHQLAVERSGLYSEGPGAHGESRSGQTRSGFDEGGGVSGQLHLAGPESGIAGKAGLQKDHVFRHRQPAPHQPRPEDGRPQRHGQHRRLSGGNRGGQSLRAILYRSGHRCR